MDDTFDVVVCGTGLKECILSGLLSVHGKKVLHVDKNSYYGGDTASLNLTNLFEKYAPGEKPPQSWGVNRDWNVDVIPKFLMASGKLVKILVHTKIDRYLDQWHTVDGTYVFQHQKKGWFNDERNIICKVPASEMEALKTPLLSLMERPSAMSFFQFCSQWNSQDPKTWKKFDPNSTPMTEVYQSFGLSSNAIDFVGHAIALYMNDEYLTKPMGHTLDRIRLYLDSLVTHGKSPFVYPYYGLGGMPEGFSRLCAVHGGTFMLNKPIKGFKYDSEGKVCGVESEDGQVAQCKMVVCDPSYVSGTNKTKKTGRVIRAICILNAPIPNTKDSHSCQIILPQKQLDRHNDIYVAMVSSAHGVAKQGKYIALVSTTVETKNPEKEIEPALELLGPIERKFVEVSDCFEPLDDGTKDNIFVSSTYDATSHFETVADEVLKMWKNISGEPLDLTKKPDPQPEDE